MSIVSRAILSSSASGLCRAGQDAGRLGRVALGEADRALQPLRPATCRRTGQPGQGAAERVLGPDRVAGHEPGLSHGDFPFGAAGVVGRQVGRAPQQRGPGRVSATGARPFGRVLELGRELLVGDDRRRGQVPHAQVRVARIGQRTMCLPAVSGARAVIHRGPQQRVAEPHRAAGELQHAGPGRFG